MTEEFDELKPGALAIAEYVTLKRARLDARNVILTDRPEDVAAYLPKYCHTMHELIEVGPWGSYASFKEDAGKNMVRLYLSDKAREACADELSRLNDKQRRANFLFSYEDAADWIHKNIESEVMSVVVPLSIFATDPDALRAQFLEERRARFQKIEEVGGKCSARKPLCRWKVVRQLPAYIQSQLGCWQSDYNNERARQGVAWPNPPSLKVTLPEGVFARYLDFKDVSETIGRSRNTIFFEGYAVHRNNEHTNPYCRRHYTPGLLLGKPENWPDYEIGMVDVMSMPRAISILGKDFLQKSGWRLSTDDVVWCRDKTVLHDIKLAREFRIILGIQRGNCTSN